MHGEQLSLVSLTLVVAIQIGLGQACSAMPFCCQFQTYTCKASLFSHVLPTCSFAGLCIVSFRDLEGVFPRLLMAQPLALALGTSFFQKPRVYGGAVSFVTRVFPGSPAGKLCSGIQLPSDFLLSPSPVDSPECADLAVTRASPSDLSLAPSIGVRGVQAQLS